MEDKIFDQIYEDAKKQADGKRPVFLDEVDGLDEVPADLREMFEEKESIELPQEVLDRMKIIPLKEPTEEELREIRNASKSNEEVGRHR